MTSHFGVSDRHPGGQHFSTILVEECTAWETSLGLANSGALSVMDGASTFVVGVQDLHALKILATLVPHLLSNACASLSRAPSPTPKLGSIEGLWGWLLLAGLILAMEDAILVAANAVQ